MDSQIIVKTCYEHVHEDKLKLILLHQNHFIKQMNPQFSFSTLQQYQKKIKNGLIKVQYQQKDKRGRIWAIGSQSLQSFPRIIRGTIAKGIYYDIDMVNAHPTILKFLCDEYKQDCSNLTLYINNRDKIIADIFACNLNESYDSIKNGILAIINGGNCIFNKLNKTKWLIDFKAEIATIHDKFASKFATYFEKVRQHRILEGKNYNHKASLMNHLLCNYENVYLTCMIEYLKTKKIINKIYVCCFDGIMIPIDKVKNIDVLLANLEKEIYTQYNIKLSLKVKEMAELDMTDIPQTQIKEEKRHKNDQPEQKFFNKDENYYFANFREDLISTIWDSFELLEQFYHVNINRVIFMTETEFKYLKIDSDNLYQDVKKIPNFKIEYKCQEERRIITIKDINFTPLFNSMINSVRRFNQIINKPISPINDCNQNYDRYFNLWNGFQAKLIPEEEIENNKFEMIMNHIKLVWADNDDKIFKYILSWFHKIFTRPFEKTKIAMVFQSDEQQIGKSILVEEFLNKFVFGKRLSTVESGLGFATERFNEHIMGKLFMTCEELSTLTGDYHRTFDTLKKIITNSTIKIEIKGGEKFEIDDYINLILFTNNNFTVKIEKNDARYFINKCNPCYKGNYEYFNKLVDSFDQETANHWFSHVFYMKDAVELRNIPETNIKKEMKLNSLPSTQRFLQSIKEIRHENIVNGTFGDENELTGWRYRACKANSVGGTELYNIYKNYCSEDNERAQSMTQFGRDVCNMITRRRTKAMMVYDLDTIKTI